VYLYKNNFILRNIKFVVSAAFIYLLDTKYNLFNNKKIYLYPIRGYTKMFNDPIKLDNWIFVKQNFFTIEYIKNIIPNFTRHIDLNIYLDYIKHAF